MASVLKGQQRGETLDQFLERVVRPREDEMEELREVVDDFAQFLMKDFPFSVSKVVKAGSLGKGTSVRDSADIDLVVYVNGLNSIRQLSRKKRLLLEALKERAARYPDWSEEIEEDKTTRFSVSFSHGEHEVDILPASDVLKQYGSAEDVYNAMEQPYLRARDNRSRTKRRNKLAMYYSASLAPLQVEFIKHIPGHVKDVIRLLKYWKKKSFPTLRSYSVELATVYVWRKGETSTDELFAGVLELLTTKPLRVYFDDNYDSDEYMHQWKGEYIMDPANPYTNTLRGVNVRKMRKAANATLRLLGKRN